MYSIQKFLSVNTISINALSPIRKTPLLRYRCAECELALRRETAPELAGRVHSDADLHGRHRDRHPRAHRRVECRDEHEVFAPGSERISSSHQTGGHSMLPASARALHIGFEGQQNLELCAWH